MRKIKRRKKEMSVISLASLVEDALGMAYWNPAIHNKRNNLLLTLDKDLGNHTKLSECRTNPNVAFYFRYLYGKWLYYLENPPNQYYGPEDKYQGWFYLVPRKVDNWFKSVHGLNKYQTRKNYIKQLINLNLLVTHKIKAIPTKSYYKINFPELLRRYQIQRERSRLDALQFSNFGKLDFHPEACFGTIKDISNNNNNILLRNITNCKQRNLSESPLRKKLTDKPRIINRRTNNPAIDEVISHWSSLSHPLAKVREYKTLYPLIRKAAKTSAGYKEVIKVIDKAFEYISEPNFKYANNSNFTMKSFFLKPYNKTYAAKFFAKNKIRSWYLLFRSKSDEWLTENLLDIPKIKDQEAFDYIYNYFRNIDKITAITASNKMYSFTYKNGTHLSDFDRYFREAYPDIRNFKVYWLKSDKFWNNQFAKYLVSFGRFKHIDEVKKI